MESQNGFIFIDGKNLSLGELKTRLEILGHRNIRNIMDHNYLADTYNFILNSGDIRYISKIKNFLDQDKENPKFFYLLNRKRIREPSSERNDKNNFIEPYSRGYNSSNNIKNG